MNTITICGETYKLLGDAEITNRMGSAVYVAPAIKADDKPDDYGTIPAYELVWTIPDVDSPEDVIDWYEPDEINPMGGEHNQSYYEVKTGRFV